VSGSVGRVNRSPNGRRGVMLGEFFAARADEVDDAVVEDGPFGRFARSSTRPLRLVKPSSTVQ
jgi:hypothetical protein